MGPWRIYENMSFWVSFSRTCWKPFLGPICGQFGVPVVVVVDVFVDNKFDVDFGPYVGSILDPFLMLSVIQSSLYGHLKTMQNHGVFRVFWPYQHSRGIQNCIRNLTKRSLILKPENNP